MGPSPQLVQYTEFLQPYDKKISSNWGLVYKNVHTGMNKDLFKTVLNTSLVE